MGSTFGLFSLCLAGFAAAHHAQPVTTAAIKTAFETAGIIPEVIPSLNPLVSFYATYTNQAGTDKLLTPGVTMIASEAAFPKEFSVENMAMAAPNVTDDSRFLIYILDADAPSRNDPTARNLRHYLGGNYTMTNQPALLATARTMVTNSEPFTPFIQPAPAALTGIHRFIIALYIQPEQYNNAGFESVGMDPRRENWNLTEWRTQLGLGPALSATFFQINTDPNVVIAAGPSVTFSVRTAALGAFVGVLGAMFAFA